MSPEEFAAISGGTLALLGVLGVVVRVVRRLVKAGRHAARRLERIEELANELAPNGGDSIKDAVHRMDGTLKTVVEKQSEHETRIARTEGRVEAIALVTSPTMLVEDDEGVIREAKAK